MSSKMITFRIPAALHSRILEEAERMNTNVADATRQLLADHFNRERIEDRLDKISGNVDKLVSAIVE